MMKTIHRILTISFIGAFFWLQTNTANAQQHVDNKTFKEVEHQLFPGWKTSNVQESDEVQIPGVIGTQNDDIRIFQYLPRLADLLLKIIAPIMVVLVLYTGTRLIIGGDDPDEQGKAKDFFVYALIGLAFIVLSYSIMKTVYNLLA